MFDVRDALTTQQQPHHRRLATRVPVDERWQVVMDRVGVTTQRWGVADVCFAGIALRGEAPTPKGVAMARLFVGSLLICRFALTLRHVSPQPSQSMAKLGFTVAFADAAERQRFFAAVRGVLFPRVRSGARYSAQIWQILARSGFFQLDGRHIGHFDSQKKHFYAFNSVLEHAPALGHQLVWQDDGQTEASVAACMPFRSTHVLHHLGRSGQGPAGRRGLRDVLLCSVELSKQEPAVSYLAAHLDHNAAFHQHHAMAFAQTRAHSGHIALQPAHFYELNALCVTGSEFPPGIYVRPTTAQDEALLCARVVHLWGPVYAAAFDLTLQSLHATASIARWAEAKLLRERDTAVAYGLHGEPLVACILDRATPGSDLFHTFDALMLVPMTDDLTAPQMQAALALLVAYAKNWFLLRGVGQFIYADVAGGFSDAAPPGGISRGKGAVWVVARPLFGALQDYLQRELTPSFAAAPSVAH